MVTTTITEVLKARTALALRAFLCPKSEHFKHRAIISDNAFLRFASKASLYPMTFRTGYQPSPTHHLSALIFCTPSHLFRQKFYYQLNLIIFLNWHTSCFITLRTYLRIGMVLENEHLKVMV